MNLGSCIEEEDGEEEESHVVHKQPFEWGWGAVVASEKV